ncbi:MAG TPA: hypothetical protein VN954_11885 [Ktedonobacteraceae bacterium]|nr:hypothetical protein [Ktedonobacteraceae bacterium]
MRKLSEEKNAPVAGAFFSSHLHVSVQFRLCELLRPPMSVGALYGQVERCAEQLEPIEQQIKTALSHANVLHQPSRAFTISRLIR